MFAKALRIGLLCGCALLLGCSSRLAIPASSAGSDLPAPNTWETPTSTPLAAARPAQPLAPPQPDPPDLPAQTGQPAPPATAAPAAAATADGGPVAAPCSPLEGHPLTELPQIVSDPYHPPPPGREERHQGVDFSYYRRGERLSIQGVPVLAVLPGEVALAQPEAFPYGNLVIVETPRSALPARLVEALGVGEREALYTLYAHLEAAPRVVTGDPVPACAPLGAVGKSGNAGVAHLHLEMRLGPAGARLDPLRYYDLQASAQEQASYLRWRISGEFRHFDPLIVLAP